MAIVRWRDNVWDPMDEIQRLQTSINDLFDFPRFPTRRGLFDRAMSPAIDVTENDDGYTVSCDLPGVKQKDVSLSIASNVLTIKGEKKGEFRKEGRNVFRKETWEGSFQRTISLPTEVDSGKVEAELKDGVLKITLPKREEVKPKQIELKVK
jgi:HSP20 family protein